MHLESLFILLWVESVFATEFILNFLVVKHLYTPQWFQDLQSCLDGHKMWPICVFFYYIHALCPYLLLPNIYVNYIFFYIQFFLVSYVKKLTCNVKLMIINKFAAVLLVIKCFDMQLKSLIPHVRLDWVKCLCEKTVQMASSK